MATTASVIDTTLPASLHSCRLCASRYRYSFFCSMSSSARVCSDTALLYAPVAFVKTVFFESTPGTI